MPTNSLPTLSCELLTHSELLSKIEKHELVKGSLYIIKDYLTIYQSNHLLNSGKYETWGYKGKVESKVWKLLVTAISDSILNPQVVILEHPLYIVKYDITPIIFDDGRVNKGTITYLLDSNNNCAYYDFKNVKFRRTNENGARNYYTFSYIDSGYIKDASETNRVMFNQLGPKCWNNVFIGDTLFNQMEAECTSNTFYKGSSKCILNYGSSMNTFEERVNNLNGTIKRQYISKGNLILSSTSFKQIQDSNGVAILTSLDTITLINKITILHN